MVHDGKKTKYFLCRYIKLKYIINLLLYERLFRKNNIVICFFQPNKLAALLEKFGKTGDSFLLHLNYDISQMRNVDGVPLLNASAREDLYGVIEKIQVENLLKYLNDKLSTIKKDLALYIRQRIAFDIYHDLLLANVAHWLATNKESKLYNKHPILIIEKRNYWICLVLDYLKRKNVQYKIFPAIDFKKNKGILFSYYAVKLCIELAKAIVVTPKKNETSGDVKIGVPFYAFQNFTEYYDLKNYYLFWFEKSGIDPEKILIYIPEREINISDEEINNIKKAKFNIVFCPTRITRKRKCDVPIHRCSLKASSLLIQYLAQIIKIYKHSKNRSMKEQWKILTLLLIQLPYWEDFFQSNNIKVKFRFHDIFGVRDIAAKLSGTVTISYHYSDHSDARIVRDEVSDVFFIWGKKYRNCLSMAHSTTKNLIITGYIFDYTFDRLKSRAQLIKDSFNNRVVYLIGVLSENLGFYLAKTQMKCYESVLEYTVNNSDVGLIIKPKKENDDSRLKTADETKDFVDVLIKQDRIKFLSSGKYPVEAGLASNIVIGMIPDSTAALEGALAGVPTVIYDCTNSGESHPLYISGHNKIIFNNMDQLLNMINSDKKNPGSISGFADWSPILMDIDPFRDGKANIRIGFYIKTLICKLDDGLTKDDVIKTANETYANEFGWDKVVFSFD